MKTNLTRAVVILVILAVLGWFGYNTWSKREQEKIEEKKHADHLAKMTEELAAYARRFNAVTDWEDKIKDVRFSVGLEDVFATSAGRSILINVVSIDDVIRHGDKYYLCFDDWDAQKIHFVLECDLALAKGLLKEEPSASGCAIIAQIISVEKAGLQLKSGVTTSEDESPIELDSSDLFIAHGRCLDLLMKNEKQ